MLRSNFNPRTPRGVRPKSRFILHGQARFQSTHPARGATSYRCQFEANQRISIHAPREGCDISMATADGDLLTISIHAPREGCDFFAFSSSTPHTLFQSTHPARGATARRFILTLHSLNFNPRTPRGVRPNQFQGQMKEYKFQSTHPARGATANFTKEQGVCLAQFAYLHKGKKAEHTKTNAPMLH